MLNVWWGKWRARVRERKWEIPFVSFHAVLFIEFYFSSFFGVRVVAPLRLRYASIYLMLLHNILFVVVSVIFPSFVNGFTLLSVDDGGIRFALLLYSQVSKWKWTHVNAIEMSVGVGSNIVVVQSALAFAYAKSCKTYAECAFGEKNIIQI